MWFYKKKDITYQEFRALVVAVCSGVLFFASCSRLISKCGIKTPRNDIRGKESAGLKRVNEYIDTNFDSYSTDCQPVKYRKTDVDVLSIDHNIGVNIRDTRGRTLLHTLALNGIPKIIHGVLKVDGIEVNAQDELGYTPLHYATCRGCINTVEELLNSNANPNISNNNGYTPIYFAVYFGHFNIVQALIDHEANFNVANKNGYTPLHLAACYGRLEIVQELIDNNADHHIADKNGCTPLHYAAGWGGV